MFYFIPGVYIPNTAASIRSIAYLRFISERGIKTKVVFFNSDKNKSSIQPMPSIDVDNIWERYFFKKGILQYISLLWNLIKFRYSLKKGDIVYCYENVQYWKLFLKKGVKVYSEYTENPDIIGLGGKFLYTSKRRFRALCKKLSGLFVISTPLKDYFVNMGVDENRIHIVNIIVDEKRFEGVIKESGVESYIAYCGAASNNKDGVDQLIQSFALVHKVFPLIKLYIIGNNPNKAQGYTNEQLVKDLEIDDVVVFTGSVSSEDIPQLLKNAMILVLDRPQNIQAQYGFPTKIGEYLLTGNPTVVTKVGDLSLFLKDKISTVFAEPDNPNDFSEKIIWCLSHYSEAQIIGMRGKEVAQKYFSYKTETMKMLNVMIG